MTPDIFDFIMSELGLDACSDSVASVAARGSASPRAGANLPTPPDEQDAAKRHCENNMDALRNAPNGVIADQPQKPVIVRGREGSARRSKENL